MNAAMRSTAHVASAYAPLARVEVFTDFDRAIPHWRTLEAAGAVATPYQGHQFLGSWQVHIGAPCGVTPLIAIGFDGNGAAAMLLPLGRRSAVGFRVAEFLGGKHANFNMALWRPDIAATIDARALHSTLDQLSAHTDVLALRSQPFFWNGAANPLALLPHQRATDPASSGALGADFDGLLRERTSSSTRKKMRKKEAALAQAGPLRFARAQSPSEQARVLNAFFAQKTARMRALGMPDVFADVHVQQFITTAVAARLDTGEPVIELSSLSVGDTIVATQGGLVGGGRYCGMFNSIIEGPIATQSPGEQILLALVRDCCERGLARFDLGVGEARYKGIFCPDDEPLFDSFLPLTPAGKLLAVAARSSAAAKRTIKQSPALWSLVQTMRRLRASKS